MLGYSFFFKDDEKCEDINDFISEKFLSPQKRLELIYGALTVQEGDCTGQVLF